MKNIFKSDALLLKKINLSESDMVCVFFTRDYGVVKSVVKYAQTKNPKNSSLQVFNVFELEFTKSDTTEFVKTKWQIKQSFQNNFLFDNKKLLLVNMLNSFLQSVLMENEEHKNIYDLVIRFLSDINLKNYFLTEKDLLKELGFGYDFSKCQMCGNKEIYYISPNTGACSCKNCGEKFSDKLFIMPQYFSIGQFTEEQLIQASNLNLFFLKKYFLLPPDFLKNREKILL